MMAVEAATTLFAITHTRVSNKPGRLHYVTARYNISCSVGSGREVSDLVGGAGKCSISS